MKTIIVMALTGLLAGLVAVGASAEPTTDVLKFESECLDLDGGEVSDSCHEPTAEGESAWDVLVAYHSERDEHAVLLVNSLEEVEIAYLEGRTFEDVSSADVEGASFGTEPLDEPVGSTRVFLIRTDEGAIYKLGNVAEDEDGLTFEHELL